MLEVHNLHQYYGGSHILRNVSVKAEIGKITVLLGRNGVGKTTLLKSLMGLVPIKSGRIEWQGQNIARNTPYERARKGIGYVPQGREIFSRLSVEDNLMTGAFTRKDGKAYIDVGSFSSELATQPQPDGSLAFVTIDPVAAGFQLIRADKDGVRKLIVRDGQHEYVFDEVK